MFVLKSQLVSLDFEVQMHSSKMVLKTFLGSFAQFELRITFSLTQWELTNLRQYKLTDIKRQTSNSLRFSQCLDRNRILVDKARLSALKSVKQEIYTNTSLLNSSKT